jgi:beta-lactamase class A
VDLWLRAHGIQGIRVDRTIAQLLGDRRDLRDVRDSSTPMAMLRLLQMIDTGQALSAGSRDLLLDMMGNCITGRNRIRGLLPPGTRVEHKTGTLSGYTGDVAFVTLPDGRRVAMVLFARGGDNRSGVIATAARAIYDGFTADGGIPNAAFAFQPQAPDRAVGLQGANAIFTRSTSELDGRPGLEPMRRNPFPRQPQSSPAPTARR